MGHDRGHRCALLSRDALPRAGSLFTLTVERELEGGRHQRSALRILASPGATRPCPRLYVLELQLCAGLSHVPYPGTPVVLLWVRRDLVPL